MLRVARYQPSSSQRFQRLPSHPAFAEERNIYLIDLSRLQPGDCFTLHDERQMPVAEVRFEDDKIIVINNSDHELKITGQAPSCGEVEIWSDHKVTFAYSGHLPKLQVKAPKIYSEAVYLLEEDDSAVDIYLQDLREGDEYKIYGANGDLRFYVKNDGGDITLISKAEKEINLYGTANLKSLHILSESMLVFKESCQVLGELNIETQDLIVSEGCVLSQSQLPTVGSQSVITVKGQLIVEANASIDLTDVRCAIKECFNDGRIAFHANHLKPEYGIVPEGLDFVPVPEDGNCLFHAVALHCGENAASLRQKVVDYLREHHEKYQSFVTDNFDDYLQKMSMDGTWGGELELQVLQKLLDRKIAIFHTDHQRCGPGEHQYPLLVGDATITKNPPIALVYNGSHYNSFVVKDGYDAWVLQERARKAKLSGVPLFYNWREPSVKPLVDIQYCAANGDVTLDACYAVCHQWQQQVGQLSLVDGARVVAQAYEVEDQKILPAEFAVSDGASLALEQSALKVLGDAEVDGKLAVSQSQLTAVGGLSLRGETHVFGEVAKVTVHGNCDIEKQFLSEKAQWVIAGRLRLANCVDSSDYVGAYVFDCSQVQAGTMAVQHKTILSGGSLLRLVNGERVDSIFTQLVIVGSALASSNKLHVGKDGLFTEFESKKEFMPSQVKSVYVYGGLDLVGSSLFVAKAANFHLHNPQLTYSALIVDENGELQLNPKAPLSMMHAELKARDIALPNEVQAKGISSARAADRVSFPRGVKVSGDTLQAHGYTVETNGGDFSGLSVLQENGSWVFNYGNMDVGGDAIVRANRAFVNASSHFGTKKSFTVEAPLNANFGDISADNYSRQTLLSFNGLLRANTARNRDLCQVFRGVVMPRNMLAWSTWGLDDCQIYNEDGKLSLSWSASGASKFTSQAATVGRTAANILTFFGFEAVLKPFEQAQSVYNFLNGAHGFYLSARGSIIADIKYFKQMLESTDTFKQQVEQGASWVVAAEAAFRHEVTSDNFYKWLSKRDLQDLVSFFFKLWDYVSLYNKVNNFFSPDSPLTKREQQEAAAASLKEEARRAGLSEVERSAEDEKAAKSKAEDIAKNIGSFREIISYFTSFITKKENEEHNRLSKIFSLLTEFVIQCQGSSVTENGVLNFGNGAAFSTNIDSSALFNRNDCTFFAGASVSTWTCEALSGEQVARTAVMAFRENHTGYKYDGTYHFGTGQTVFSFNGPMINLSKNKGLGGSVMYRNESDTGQADFDSNLADFTGFSLVAHHGGGSRWGSRAKAFCTDLSETLHRTARSKIVGKRSHSIFKAHDAVVEDGVVNASITREVNGDYEHRGSGSETSAVAHDRVGGEIILPEGTSSVATERSNVHVNVRINGGTYRRLGIEEHVGDMHQSGGERELKGNEVRDELGNLMHAPAPVSGGVSETTGGRVEEGNIHKEYTEKETYSDGVERRNTTTVLSTSTLLHDNSDLSLATGASEILRVGAGSTRGGKVLKEHVDGSEENIAPSALLIENPTSVESVLDTSGFKALVSDINRVEQNIASRDMVSPHAEALIDAEKLLLLQQEKVESERLDLQQAESEFSRLLKANGLPASMTPEMIALSEQEQADYDKKKKVANRSLRGSSRSGLAELKKAKKEFEGLDKQVSKRLAMLPVVERILAKRSELENAEKRYKEVVEQRDARQQVYHQALDKVGLSNDILPSAVLVTDSERERLSQLESEKVNKLKEDEHTSVRGLTFTCQADSEVPIIINRAGKVGLGGNLREGVTGIVSGEIGFLDDLTVDGGMDLSTQVFTGAGNKVVGPYMRLQGLDWNMSGNVELRPDAAFLSVDRIKMCYGDTFAPLNLWIKRGPSGELAKINNDGGAFVPAELMQAEAVYGDSVHEGHEPSVRLVANADGGVMPMGGDAAVFRFAGNAEIGGIVFKGDSLEFANTAKPVIMANTAIKSIELINNTTVCVVLNAILDDRSEPDQYNGCGEFVGEGTYVFDFSRQKFERLNYHIAKIGIRGIGDADRHLVFGLPSNLVDTQLSGKAEKVKEKIIKRSNDDNRDRRSQQYENQVVKPARRRAKVKDKRQGTLSTINVTNEHFSDIPNKKFTQGLMVQGDYALDAFGVRAIKNRYPTISIEFNGRHIEVPLFYNDKAPATILRSLAAMQVVGWHGQNFTFSSGTQLTVRGPSTTAAEVGVLEGVGANIDIHSTVSAGWQLRIEQTGGKDYKITLHHGSAVIGGSGFNHDGVGLYMNGGLLDLLGNAQARLTGEGDGRLDLFAIQSTPVITTRWEKHKLPVSHKKGWLKKAVENSWRGIRKACGTHDVYTIEEVHTAALGGDNAVLLITTQDDSGKDALYAVHLKNVSYNGKSDFKGGHVEYTIRKHRRGMSWNKDKGTDELIKRGLLEGIIRLEVAQGNTIDVSDMNARCDKLQTLAPDGTVITGANLQAHEQTTNRTQIGLFFGGVDLSRAAFNAVNTVTAGEVPKAEFKQFVKDVIKNDPLLGALIDFAGSDSWVEKLVNGSDAMINLANEIQGIVSAASNDKLGDYLKGRLPDVEVKIIQSHKRERHEYVDPNHCYDVADWEVVAKDWVVNGGEYAVGELLTDVGTIHANALSAKHRVDETIASFGISLTGRGYNASLSHSHLSGTSHHAANFAIQHWEAKSPVAVNGTANMQVGTFKGDMQARLIALADEFSHWNASISASLSESAVGVSTSGGGGSSRRVNDGMAAINIGDASEARILSADLQGAVLHAPGAEVVGSVTQRDVAENNTSYGMSISTSFTREAKAKPVNGAPKPITKSQPQSGKLFRSLGTVGVDVHQEESVLHAAFNTDAASANATVLPERKVTKERKFHGKTQLAYVVPADWRQAGSDWRAAFTTSGREQRYRENLQRILEVDAGRRWKNGEKDWKRMSEAELRERWGDWVNKADLEKLHLELGRQSVVQGVVKGLVMFWDHTLVPAGRFIADTFESTTFYRDAVSVESFNAAQQAMQQRFAPVQQVAGDLLMSSTIARAMYGDPAYQAARDRMLQRVDRVGQSILDFRESIRSAGHYQKLEMVTAITTKLALDYVTHKLVMSGVTALHRAFRQPFDVAGITFNPARSNGVVYRANDAVAESMMRQWLHKNPAAKNGLGINIKKWSQSHFSSRSGLYAYHPGQGNVLLMQVENGRVVSSTALRVKPAAHASVKHIGTVPSPSFCSEGKLYTPSNHANDTHFPVPKREHAFNIKPINNSALIVDSGIVAGLPVREPKPNVFGIGSLPKEQRTVTIPQLRPVDPSTGLRHDITEPGVYTKPYQGDKLTDVLHHLAESDNTINQLAHRFIDQATRPNGKRQLRLFGIDKQNWMLDAHKPEVTALTDARIVDGRQELDIYIAQQTDANGSYDRPIHIRDRLMHEVGEAVRFDLQQQGLLSPQAYDNAYEALLDDHRAALEKYAGSNAKIQGMDSCGQYLSDEHAIAHELFNRLDASVGSIDSSTDLVNEAFADWFKVCGKYGHHKVAKLCPALHDHFVGVLGQSRLLPELGLSEVFADISKANFSRKYHVDADALVDAMKLPVAEAEKYNGMTFFHGTDDAPGVLEGISHGRSSERVAVGSGLYAAMPEDLQLATNFARRQTLDGEAVVMQGKIEGALRIGRFKLNDVILCPRISSDGTVILPKNWNRIPALQKMMHDNFDLLVMGGSFPFFVYDEGVLLFHETAGKAIKWEALRKPFHHTFKAATLDNSPVVASFADAVKGGVKQLVSVAKTHVKVDRARQAAMQALAEQFADSEFTVVGTIRRLHDPQYQVNTGKAKPKAHLHFVGDIPKNTPSAVVFNDAHMFGRKRQDVVRISRGLAVELVTVDLRDLPTKIAPNPIVEVPIHFHSMIECKFDSSKGFVEDVIFAENEEVAEAAASVLRSLKAKPGAAEILAMLMPRVGLRKSHELQINCFAAESLHRSVIDKLPAVRGEFEMSRQSHRFRTKTHGKINLAFGDNWQQEMPLVMMHEFHHELIENRFPALSAATKARLLREVADSYEAIQANMTTLSAEQQAIVKLFYKPIQSQITALLKHYDSSKKCFAPEFKLSDELLSEVRAQWGMIYSCYGNRVAKACLPGLHEKMLAEFKRLKAGKSAYVKRTTKTTVNVHEPLLVAEMRRPAPPQYRVKVKGEELAEQVAMPQAFADNLARFGTKARPPLFYHPSGDFVDVMRDGVLLPFDFIRKIPELFETIKSHSSPLRGYLNNSIDSDVRVSCGENDIIGLDLSFRLSRDVNRCVEIHYVIMPDGELRISNGVVDKIDPMANLRYETHTTTMPNGDIRVSQKLVPAGSSPVPNISHSQIAAGSNAVLAAGVAHVDLFTGDIIKLTNKSDYKISGNHLRRLVTHVWRREGFDVPPNVFFNEMPLNMETLHKASTIPSHRPAYWHGRRQALFRPHQPAGSLSQRDGNSLTARRVVEQTTLAGQRVRAATSQFFQAAANGAAAAAVPKRSYADVLKTKKSKP